MTSVHDFILEAKFPTWDSKSRVLEELEESLVLTSSYYFCLEGVLVLRKINEDTLHCSLLIAKTKRALRDLVTKFLKEFPEVKVLTAHRKNILIRYSNLQKLCSKLLAS